ncbi:hypothetical protein JHK82_021946 [Glycine max]|uniref:uncharacterized protein isoform X1 n=1 Tax=Glycine max TaxID=3847 RepID=UPI0002338DFF|nr:uncharacterized protein LOC100815479 isoform X1 [Glycine max]XP_028245526.1 uncharacterized protein LOC114423104 isoform X1 [Glycine soja]KAG4399309.1 hypothetical protein GLYMA_08G206500v4 [Glycine max]KAG5137215.1 hypothetical protein JHK82_021946 [Glycine max]KAH1052251.1 hypothetical protein GYH30_021875 [Glycine max]|eukprot:XP_003531681.1 uncharacterized protein LOC100815479 isoform X1 [Glycine max]
MEKALWRSKYVVSGGGLKWMVFVVVCVACVVGIWPWYPELKIERMEVKRVKVRPVPPVGADVSISMSVRVRNRDIYWMEMREVDVGMKYRRKKMGHVELKGWQVKGWSSTHVEAEVVFAELPSSQVPYLLEDVAKGKVYFRTVVELSGQFGILSFRTPLPLEFKTILACEILVNTKNHSIILQHCLHKD